MSADETLREAIERLADEWGSVDAWGAGVALTGADAAEALRALLAEHPATPTEECIESARIAALADYLTRKVGEPKLPIGTRVAVRSFKGAVGTVVAPDGYPKGSALAVRMDPPYPKGFHDGYACVAVDECSVIPPGAPAVEVAVEDREALAQSVVDAVSALDVVDLIRDHDAALTAKAKAEALREAADDVHEVSGHSAGVPVWRADIADWLRERADREES